MCGIVGFIDRGGSFSNFACEIRKMSDSLTHRGPDNYGSWLDESGVGLGHRRLSIIDTSDAGSQPMASKSKRYILIFNGEIYNHLDLRMRLEREQSSINWYGHSDTETLLCCIEFWGVHATLKVLDGMFALALWDRELKKLVLARDRFGEKPLFYGWQKSTFLFGSELKGLCAHSSWSGKLNPGSIQEFIRYGYIPAPNSIWQGIFKVPPGSFLNISLNDPVGVEPKVESYWKYSDLYDESDHHEMHGYRESVDQLETLLIKSVSSRMLSDVPIGAFLSGGVDSATIVALMQSISTQKINTFTIGFTEADFNEAIYAEKVAKYLGTNHTELYVTPGDVMGVIPSLPTMYDEPFGDSSQMPTYLVAQLAKKTVKVCLSGDGGDEIFGGYNRYLLGDNLKNYVNRFPVSMRRLLEAGVKKISPQTWDGINLILPKSLRRPMFGDKMYKFASILGAKTEAELYEYLVSHDTNPRSLLRAKSDPADVSVGWGLSQGDKCLGPTFVEKMMYLDALTYLPDDILTKVDRASMASSLEVRAPFLDPKIASFMMGMPLDYKVSAGQGKHLLRMVLYKYLPRELIDRPKQGFGVPLGLWLRGPLKDWAEDLIDPVKLRDQGIFDHKLILERWQEHLSGKRNWQNWLWNILMFQSWYAIWGAKSN